MAATDIYLCPASHGATDIDLRTATPCGAAEQTSPAGGNLRRHQGKSTGADKHVQRFINFRWTFTVTVDGSTSTRTRTAPPHLAVTGGHVRGGSAVRTRHTLRVAAQITATPAHIRPCAPRTWVDDEDELLLLDLL